MDEGRFKNLLAELEEQRVPATVDLWPGIQDEAHVKSRREAGRRRGLKTAFSLTMVFLSLSVLLLAFSPGLRRAGAQAIREIGAMVGMTDDLKGPNSFSPSPPFIVKLPGYLPEGFEYVSGQYNPGVENLPSIQEEVVRPGQQTVEPANQPAEERDTGREASILVRYRGKAGRYFELYERQALAGEKLPQGEELLVNREVARLQRDGGERLTLTWVEAGTRIELSGRLPEDALLQIATELVTTQTSQSQANLPRGLPDRQAIEATEQASFCNPKDYVPEDGNLLGDVPNQRNKGTIRIDLFHEGQYPFPATVAWGANVQNQIDEVFKPALKALKDPATAMQPLPYKAIGMYTNTNGCMEPNPAVSGYFLIEVWDQQVNVGYGGEALALRDLAIQRLEREMEGLH